MGGVGNEEKTTRLNGESKVLAEELCTMHDASGSDGNSWCGSLITPAF